MRIFDYIDTIEKPTIDNIRVIYKAINVKYDELIDMAVEPNSKNYNKWMQTLDCLKASEDLIIDCITNNKITDMEWLQLKCDIYKYQVKYGGLKYLNLILKFKYKWYKKGFFSLKEFIITGGSSLIVALMPNKLRTFVYKKLLRK